MAPELLMLAPGTILVRHAVATDLSALSDLISSWAEVGLMLPRDHKDLESSCEDFVIAERLSEAGEHELIACGALEVIRAGQLAEIRSVAVNSSARGTGTGAAVVNALVEKARAQNIEKVVLLTKTPGFFERCGFIELPEADLPEAFRARLAVQGRTLENRTAMRAPQPESP